MVFPLGNVHESTANVVYEDESYSSPLFMNFFSKKVLNSDTFIISLSLLPSHGGRAAWGQSYRRRLCRWQRSCSPWAHRRWRWRLCRGRAQQLAWSPWWPRSTGPGRLSDDSSCPSHPPPRWGCGNGSSYVDKYRKAAWKCFRTGISEPLPLCFLRVACDEVAIHVEEADPQQVEDNI